jgi:hypothetical protein
VFLGLQPDAVRFGFAFHACGGPASCHGFAVLRAAFLAGSGSVAAGKVGPVAALQFVKDLQLRRAGLRCLLRVHLPVVAF